MRQVATTGRRRRLAVIVMLLAPLLAIAGIRWFTAAPPRQPPARVPAGDAPALQPVAETAPLPIRATRFVNAAPDVGYVGSEACAACHAAQHASYLRTAHSTALGDIDLDAEPPDGQFDYANAGRHYAAFRRNGRLWHRETLLDAQGQDLLSVEYEMRYAIGSGHHSRSYLAAIDRFLVESPLTWYAAQRDWALSPGYDEVHHASFERLADQGCLCCHAGRVTLENGNRNRLKIHEAAIGCESCHGPGALHVAKRREPADDAGAEDLTIVHPARLGRDESEAICACCHLRGAASVLLRGRQLDDFRPGQRLEDFRVDFVPRTTDQIMKVVGHVEQLRASRCYQETDSLTCITCHDPHAPPTAGERIALYREKCNECHHEHCGLPREKRVTADQRDNCVACHMPQRPTNLPHFAFTHHRIGVHADQSGGPPPATSVVDLVPVPDLSKLPPLDRERVLGLAYLEYAVQQVGEQNRRECLGRAESLLDSAAEGGLRDADVLAALAILAWQRDDLPRAERLAAEAAAQPPLGSHAPANALLVLADLQMQRRNFPASAQLLSRLIELRRSSDDWILLGRVRGAAGDIAGAADALRYAAQIHPFRLEIHVLLSGTYARLGDSAAARKHQQISEALLANQPKSRPLAE
jgi:hypothetical protein